jgi:hypothetical protein
MQNKIKSKVRDMRRKDKFQVDDAYLNGYARLCGIFATGVYVSLCRHANFHTQECWPAVETIKSELNIAKNSVTRGISALQEWGIISVIRERDEKGRKRVNVYILIDKSEWKPKPDVHDPVASVDVHAPVGNNPRPCGEQTHTPVVSYKVTKGRRLQIEGYKENTSAPEGATILSENNVSLKANPAFKSGSERGDEKSVSKKMSVAEKNKISENDIADVIDAFKTVNPMYRELFYRKVERGASESLLKVLGKENLLEIVDILQQTNMQEFAPRITTPRQLQEKLGKLQIFVRQYQQKAGISVEELLK